MKMIVVKIANRNPDLRIKDQVTVIQNVEFFFDLSEKISTFFRDYSFLPKSETEYKAKHEKGIPSNLARVAEVPDRKFFDRTPLKALTIKQILQRLPIALSQVKVGNTYENLLNEIRQIMYSLYPAKDIAKKFIELNKVIKQNVYYIYEF